jgi:hypothetical protein
MRQMIVLTNAAAVVDPAASDTLYDPPLGFSRFGA